MTQVARHDDATSEERTEDDGRRIDARSVVLLAAGMACFGTATPVSAIVGREFPPFLASFGRLAIAAAILVPVLLTVTSRDDDRTGVRESARRCGSGVCAG